MKYSRTLTKIFQLEIETDDKLSVEEVEGLIVAAQKSIDEDRFLEMSGMAEGDTWEAIGNDARSHIKIWRMK